MYIKVPPELVRRMRELAEREGEFVAKTLGDLLDQYDKDLPRYIPMDELERLASQRRERRNKDSPAEIAEAAPCPEVMRQDASACPSAAKIVDQ